MAAARPDGAPLMPAALSRRQALRLGAGLGLAVPLATAWGRPAPAANSLRLAAAWQQEDGGYRIGVLETQPGQNTPLKATHTLDIPTRAHGLCPLPDGSIVAASRRPGDWLVRWWPGTGREPVWQWSDGARSFNGHVIASPDGRLLYATETDAETGQSLVVQRSADTLDTLQAWPTKGIDAHELIWDRRTLAGGAPTLLVANGGVPTAPETGRVKRALDTMDSSIVRLHGRTGEVLGQWRLDDPRLSLRHLAWSPNGSVLGIALQAEHDSPADRNAAPVLALFDGKALRTAAPAPQQARGNLQEGLRGYGGSIAATPEGWAVSCPRAQGIATFGPRGDWQRLVDLPEVCALAVQGSALWAAGLEHTLEDARGQDSRPHWHGDGLNKARVDNHWVLAGKP
ncbi:DUF1513 domain-containing protein [Paracidovorax valerianellae]|uniref:DUF1513 domain-containing protein n=1 Tax=Paracidovorax valerianellae TaxID=187868 RepID=UPI0023032F3D|nr:DUF1513 domain-containing protein [Paracidovorax valerianellae]MDA8444031.1 DUF1513 domain-containing protein [Paracidovorax valerianellae]